MFKIYIVFEVSVKWVVFEGDRGKKEHFNVMIKSFVPHGNIIDVLRVSIESQFRMLTMD